MRGELARPVCPAARLAAARLAEDRDRDRERLNRRGVRVVGSGYEPFTIPELILENCNQSDIFAGKLLQQHDWQGRRNQLNLTHHG